MQWAGEERRSIPTVTRAEFTEFVTQSNQQRHELRDMVREIKGSIIEIQRDIKCVHTTWDAHVAEYGEILKHTKSDREKTEKLRTAITEKSVAGVVWGMVVLVGYALWDYVRSHVR